MALIQSAWHICNWGYTNSQLLWQSLLSLDFDFTTVFNRICCLMNTAPHYLCVSDKLQIVIIFIKNKILLFNGLFVHIPQTSRT